MRPYRLELPPRFLLLLVHAFIVEQVFLVGNFLRDEVVDDAPVGQAAYVAVVNKQVGLYLVRMVVARQFVVLVVAVNGKEAHTALLTPFHGLVQSRTFSHGPEDEVVSIFNELLECGSGKGTLFPNLGIAVFHNRSIKIYGDIHLAITSIR